ncbi:PLD nuclease N-terminal domain-containing protein [Ohtaekwangia kribbensis]|jgi:uncharacterized membrane protein YhaH (DUF805 family)|uniref:PLD nuclease N-terminal domain-containing protein n=1 Tax=Ohtaekwangia kribbensis TaxID=688913 RepID=A0ABW3K3E5_9BACT
MEENVLLYLGGIGASEILPLSIFMVLPGILWLWAIIDLVKRDFSDSATKIIWALVIIFIPFVGSILYLVVGRSKAVGS